MRFHDKVALISGAGSGIGRATAQMIGAEGGTVVGVDLDQDAVEQIMDRDMPRWRQSPCRSGQCTGGG
jgi:NAD(P)-dependent dehydrogenase (short-subunit alcohol dehydrogenase family)